ncbi:hypothetical protein [Thalassobacillus pellis]|uniref:hypothetical protein n=1 Tax=Thalassobacillus pellis TaxID=748008 RepID=UPI00196175AD|nr:hypothetical protein [Thalassobacillus pellis]MBM7553319.1 hypothetical protein [Thalassobacillus pellis]
MLKLLSMIITVSFGIYLLSSFVLESVTLLSPWYGFLFGLILLLSGLEDLKRKKRNGYITIMFGVLFFIFTPLALF